MIQQAGDFRDESEALYILLAPVSDDALERPTAFKAWTVNMILRHLHLWNHGAALALHDSAAAVKLIERMQEHIKASSISSFDEQELDGLHGRRLVDTWWSSCNDLTRLYAGVDSGLRVKWAGPSMSARSLITSRLMETWAHGQAIYDELGVERENFDRIRNIVVLGINTYGWTFQVRGLPVPTPRPFVRLGAPSGAIWSYGDDQPYERIEGLAEEYCQVVTQTRNIADTRLTVVGPNASAWMTQAQCFAGPPENPPAPGLRFRRRSA